MRTMQSNAAARYPYRIVIAVTCAAILSIIPALADEGRAEEERDHRRVSTVVSLGVQQWPALHDLDTQPYGAFEETGLNLSLGIHVPWKKYPRSEWLLGMDLGLMNHESSVTAPGDWGELSADVLYLAPSVRWSWTKPRRVRMNLETGIGMYQVSLREFIEIGYDFVEGTRHFEEWAAGGFIGASFDLPVGRTGRWSINTGARVHFVDFGNVDAYRTELGRLDGPITTLQLGLTYDWGGN